MRGPSGRRPRSRRRARRARRPSRRSARSRTSSFQAYAVTAWRQISSSVMSSTPRCITTVGSRGTPYDARRRSSSSAIGLVAGERADRRALATEERRRDPGEPEDGPAPGRGSRRRGRARSRAGTRRSRRGRSSGRLGGQPPRRRVRRPRSRGHAVPTATAAPRSRSTTCNLRRSQPVVAGLTAAQLLGADGDGCPGEQSHQASSSERVGSPGRMPRARGSLGWTARACTSMSIQG